MLVSDIFSLLASIYKKEIRMRNVHTGMIFFIVSMSTMACTKDDRKKPVVVHKCPAVVHLNTSEILNSSEFRYLQLHKTNNTKKAKQC